MRALVFATVIVALGSGCITPSIPIPPPDPERMTFDIGGDPANPGLATFSYPADDRIKNALIYIYNRDQAEGIITTAAADGSVGPTKPFPAALDDQVVITFQEADQSLSTCIRIKQGAQDPNAYCD
jgi:hypothetical protein